MNLGPGDADAPTGELMTRRCCSPPPPCARLVAMAWNLLRTLRNEDSYETRRDRFFEKLKKVGVLWVILGLLGAGETAWSLWSGIPWHGARGAVISRGEMWTGVWVFLGAVLIGSLLVWIAKRASRR